MTFDQDRWRMVQTQIHARGVRDARVLEAMSTVPREQFVPPSMRAQSYADYPLPIGHDQTISQPYVVALMLEALSLQPGDRVLEVGAGYGYAAAVMAALASSVYAIERIQPLAEMAVENLRRAGFPEVQVRCADGTQGWADAGPFNGILVSAGGPDVPGSLLEQLQIGGRLVMPVGEHLQAQQLVRVSRTGVSDFDRKPLADVRFVPLIGAEGWESTT